MVAIMTGDAGRHVLGGRLLSSSYHCMLLSCGQGCSPPQRLTHTGLPRYNVSLCLILVPGFCDVWCVLSKAKHSLVPEM